MEGLRGTRKVLEVQREFASSRLEQQILVRTYELVVPVFCRSRDIEQPTTVETNRSQRLKKGA